MALNAEAEKDDDDAQQKRWMRKICNVHDNIWLDTLAWLGRREVGMNIALVNTRFNALVDIQLKRRQWCFGEFHICERKKKGTGAEVMTNHGEGDKFITLPLAKTPLPDSIIGFKTFSIWYIDEEVITFLRNIRRLFTMNIALEFSTRLTEYRSWKAMAQHIWPLLKDGISTLVCLKKSQLELLRKHVSPTVLSDSPNLVKISTSMLPECPTNEDSDNIVGRELYMWLHSPQQIAGVPVALKLLKPKAGWNRFVQSLFTSFHEATYEVNYMVFGAFPSNNGESQQLQMENSLTDERLTVSSRLLYTSNGYELLDFLMLRSSVDFDNHTFNAWLRFAKETGPRPANLVHIGFNDDEIGHMPPSADAADVPRTEAPVPRIHSD